jgi:hypothetical protein
MAFSCVVTHAEQSPTYTTSGDATAGRRDQLAHHVDTTPVRPHLPCLTTTRPAAWLEDSLGEAECPWLKLAGPGTDDELMRTHDRPWTAVDVPPGPYFHGTRFAIEPGAAFDLTVPRAVDPDYEWGLVSDPENDGDSRRMFWATTDLEAALGWAYQKGVRLGYDRLYVWEVELDGPEVDTNMHQNRWNLPVTSVMAPTGRFVRVAQEVALADYKNRWLG